MDFIGASVLGAVSAVSSSAMPFLNALMPLATSPIMSEILPRPPKTSRPTARTIIQCQMLSEPMQSSVRRSIQAQIEPKPAARSRYRDLEFSQNLGVGGDKNKRARTAAKPQGRDNVNAAN